jgi:hypothetical protein
MIPADLKDERALRAWAIEAAITAQTTAGKGTRVDLITSAQRIVDFVKGDGAAHKQASK